MGGNVSTIPAPPANFPYFPITLRRTDHFIVVGADRATIDTIRYAIDVSWPCNNACVCVAIEEYLQTVYKERATQWAHMTSSSLVGHSLKRFGQKILPPHDACSSVF